MADLAEALRKLSALTPKLNATTDAVNTVFRGVEEHLQGLSIGIDVVTEVGELSSSARIIEDEDEGTYLENTRTSLSLVFCRIGGRYRIGFRECDDVTMGSGLNEDTSSDEKPPVAWDQAVRHWKLKGVGKIPALVENLVTEMQALVDSAELATAEVASLLASLSQKAPEPTTKVKPVTFDEAFGGKISAIERKK